MTTTIRLAYFAFVLVAALAGCSSKRTASSAKPTNSGTAAAPAKTNVAATPSACPQGEVDVDGNCYLACSTDEDCTPGTGCIDHPAGAERGMGDDGRIGPVMVRRYCMPND